MRIDVSYKHLNANDIVKSVIEKNCAKLDRHVKIYKKEAPIHLSVHIEKNPHKEQFFCWLNMYLPARVIKAAKNGKNSVVVINEAFNVMVGQMEKLKYKVEKHLGRRKIAKGKSSSI